MVKFTDGSPKKKSKSKLSSTLGGVSRTRKLKHSYSMVMNTRGGSKKSLKSPREGMSKEGGNAKKRGQSSSSIFKIAQKPEDQIHKEILAKYGK